MTWEHIACMFVGVLITITMYWFLRACLDIKRYNEEML